MTKTTTQRTAAYRARRRAEGWTILHCHIPPDVTSILAGIGKGTGLTKAEIISRLIRSYQERFGNGDAG